MPARPILCVAAAILLAAVVSADAVAGQGRKWSDPYESGVDAVSHKRWTAAIDSLTKAIAVEAKAQANKHIEGTYYEDYFPYYYRGLAYLGLGDLSNAEADFRKAHETRMPTALEATLRQREADLQAALTRQAPKPVAPATPPAAPPAAAAPPPDAAKPVVPDRTTQAAALVRQGDDLFRQGQLEDAESKFRQAQRLGGPGTAGVDDGLQRVTNRRSYESLKTAAAADRRGGHPDDALGKYDQAKTVDPQQYAADRLDAERQLAESEANTLRKATAATPPPPSPVPGASPTVSVGAPVKPPTAPPTAPPAATPAATPAKTPVVSSPPIYDALVAYLRGDVDRAVTLLQPLAADDRSFDATGRATVHGYLGVAYATTALEARLTADRDRWRQKADAEFRLAESAKPGFRLSGRIVSPVIQSMIDAARR